MNPADEYEIQTLKTILRTQKDQIAALQVEVRRLNAEMRALESLIRSLRIPRPAPPNPHWPSKVWPPPTRWAQGRIDSRISGVQDFHPRARA